MAAATTDMASARPKTRTGLEYAVAVQQLLTASQQNNSWTDWLSAAARLTQSTLDAPGIFTWDPKPPRQQDGRELGQLSGLTFPVEGLSQSHQQTLQHLAQRAWRETGIVSAPMSSGSSDAVAAVRLSRQSGALVMLALISSQPHSHELAGLWLPLVASQAELWSWRHEKAIGPTVKANPSPIGQWFSKLRSKTVLAAIAVGAAALAIPVPYAVTCDCELQPVTRRFVSAPFEGVLERALVEIGDQVTAGQTLARMDGQDVRWEQAGNTAEFERAAKERDAHLAAQEFGEAQLARLQMERLRLTGQILDRRNEFLEIKSPVDGIVVSGELKRVEGARLSMGQTLFEIAPLNQMIVEVEIPESQVADVPAEAEATVQLEAFFGERMSGRLQRICPRAELRRNRQVFVGEMPLTNDSGQLRPGMRGRVSLSAGYCSLGWRLFHRALIKFRVWGV